MKEIALHILDIAMNSIEAGSDSIYLEIRESEKDNRIELRLSDNGKGMKEQILKEASQPYGTTRLKRKVGMGLPLLKYHAESAGGGFSLNSIESKGTTVCAWFLKDHIDRQPLGDLPGVIRILLSADEKIDFKYSHQTDKGNFQISTNEILENLGEKSIFDNGLLQQIEVLIGNNLKEAGSESQCRQIISCE